MIIHKKISQHGFAPVIHGIARGTAQVSVKQNEYLWV
ncbi:fimbria/pilus outer membrane usher protein [Escherichia coli]|nr:fimbria/pilus outer membrane usher protein [Escherichia coli]EIQ8692111.1 fimbria/pilus outer membrane usher protein [Escherichia coli]EKT9129873.1 fimbria/pilus outer membrane usher protein [Escherichia coli]EKU8476418.1 fimbria/pilus outer membrane usher protein [Escherichia coli]EKU8521917.1 fimbria/pilus outer membrane usher protein [Escherichia coli]